MDLAKFVHAGCGHAQHARPANSTLSRKGMKFIRGIGWCMFFMGIGMAVRGWSDRFYYGNEVAPGIFGALIGLAIAVGMNLLINRKPRGG
jgi:hypothetical protein